MKPTSGDIVMLAVIAFAAVGFFLERGVWDPNGWDRNWLGVVMFAPLIAVYCGWRAWRWWRRRNSN
jgi:membrane protein DedA with SNARE-associated domain